MRGDNKIMFSWKKRKTIPTLSNLGKGQKYKLFRLTNYLQFIWKRINGSLHFFKFHEEIMQMEFPYFVVCSEVYVETIMMGWDGMRYTDRQTDG